MVVEVFLDLTHFSSPKLMVESFPRSVIKGTSAIRSIGSMRNQAIQGMNPIYLQAKTECFIPGRLNTIVICLYGKIICLYGNRSRFVEDK